MEKFEFETTDLSYSNIEDQVTTYYNLGYSNSSSFNELNLKCNVNLTIFASKGSIEFSAIVSETKNNTYLVCISPKLIKYKK
ncbi:MAG: hypothetical protein PHR25_02015 [Clostridia bacterium]|nr:hypothetical protein [Clostridia bacterium]